MIQEYQNTNQNALELYFEYLIDLNLVLSKIEIEFCDLSDPN